MNIRIFVLVSLVVMVTIPGCKGLDTDNMLLGTWHSVEKDNHIVSDTDLEITFFSNGTAAFQKFDFLSGKMTNYTENYSIERKDLTIGDHSYTIEKINKTEMTWKQVGNQDIYCYFKRQ